MQVLQAKASSGGREFPKGEANLKISFVGA